MHLDVRYRNRGKNDGEMRMGGGGGGGGAPSVALSKFSPVGEGSLHVAQLSEVGALLLGCGRQLALQGSMVCLRLHQQPAFKKMFQPQLSRLRPV